MALEETATGLKQKRALAETCRKRIAEEEAIREKINREAAQRIEKIEKEARARAKKSCSESAGCTRWIKSTFHYLSLPSEPDAF